MICVCERVRWGSRILLWATSLCTPRGACCGIGDALIQRYAATSISALSPRVTIHTRFASKVSNKRPWDEVDRVMRLVSAGREMRHRSLTGCMSDFPFPIRVRSAWWEGGERRSFHYSLFILNLTLHFLFWGSAFWYSHPKQNEGTVFLAARLCSQKWDNTESLDTEWDSLGSTFTYIDVLGGPICVIFHT